MMKGFFRPPCSVCGKRSATIEIVPPGELPEEFASWDRKLQEVYLKHQDSSQFYLIYAGPGGGNGLGDTVEPARAEIIVEAFTSPNKESIRAADFYDNAGFCLECSKFYCWNHWDDGRGLCPKGHWVTLDPHWSPD